MATADETRNLLIQAVMELLPDHPADVLSVRDIALRAGVNHGLVHRHFGSKEALIREALSRTNAQVHGVDPFARGVTSWSWSLLRERPDIARVLARMCLDGPHDLLPVAAPPPERIEQFAAPVRAALERAGLAGVVDPYLANALGCATLLGWAVFRPLLDAGWKVPPDADEQLARLAPLLDALLHRDDGADGAGEAAAPPPVASRRAVQEAFFVVEVRDMPRATAFYVSALGAAVMFASPAWSSLRVAGVRLGLHHHPGHADARTGLHVVVSDLPATRAEIERAGGRSEPPVEVAPGVVTVDATDTEGNTFTLRQAEPSGRPRAERRDQAIL